MRRQEKWVKKNVKQEDYEGAINKCIYNTGASYSLMCNSPIFLGSGFALPHSKMWMWMKIIRIAESSTGEDRIKCP